MALAVFRFSFSIFYFSFCIFRLVFFVPSFIPSGVELSLMSINGRGMEDRHPYIHIQWGGRTTIMYTLRSADNTFIFFRGTDNLSIYYRGGGRTT